ncbi:hypothetical protein JCM8547_007211 [Rhodosporidiobolus lusitaniae]
MSGTSLPEDVEKVAFKQGGATGEAAVFGKVDVQAEHQVKRALKARHLQMIALGGTIGTGLFVGSGSALATGGAAGIFLGYTIMGAVVYSMMVALGEMTTLFPVSGAFVHYASRFVDPALGFALGWNYWYSWAITSRSFAFADSSLSEQPTEIVAAAIVLDYWPGARSVNIAVWITVFIVVVLAFNFIGVGAFGEAEFWFSVIKITAILGLIILALIITAGGVPTSDPAEYPIGFRFWHQTPFQQLNGIPGSLGRFLSFWTVFLQASFSFLGTEIVALTAGEAENPRRNVPKAINRVFWRIIFFYVIGVLMMSMIVSPNDERLLTSASDASASPWVIGIERAGIKVLPSIINTVILVAAFSAGNSDLYAASRTLYGLSVDGQAPRIFSKVTRNGLPIWALVATSLWAFLAYMCVSTGGSTAFNYLVAISSVTGLINWAVILFSYIRFYHAGKVQGMDRNDYPYKAPFQPYLSYFGFVMICLIILFSDYQVFLKDSWDVGSFLTAYIVIPVFFIMWIGWKWWYKTTFVRLEALDFETNRCELDEMEEQQQAMYKPPKSFLARAWDVVF